MSSPSTSDRAALPAPEGPRVVPYLHVRGAVDALDLYTRAFGAEELVRLPMGDRLGHAEMTVAGALFYVSDEFPEIGVMSPASLGGTSVSLSVYVPDVDALTERARAAGLTIEREPKDEFFGDRVSKIVDPFGHRWSFHTRLEDVSYEELVRRFEAAMAAGHG